MVVSRMLPVVALCAVAAASGGGVAARAGGIDVLASRFVPPDIDRARLETGDAVFVILPAEGSDLAVVGMARTRAGGGRLVSWMRAVEHVFRGRYVLAVGRFSHPPRLADLDALALDDQDLEDVRDCSPGDCALKLAAAEIEQIRAAADAAGHAWRPAVQAAFRQVVLARAQSYLADGLARAPAYHDQRDPVSPLAEYDEVAARFDLEPLYGGRVLPYLRAYPDVSEPGVESFLYWSKETLGTGKPIVSVTHTTVFRGAGPEEPTAVAARQVFATHYLTASLSVTAVMESQPGYLIYLRRSRTDAFDGLFGPLVRRMVERRIRADAPAVLEALRQKLEAGDPPGGTH